MYVLCVLVHVCVHMYVCVYVRACISMRVGVCMHACISDIASWMTSDHLALNPSITELMLIGLLQQISQISIISLALPQNTEATRNLGYISNANLISF